MRSLDWEDEEGMGERKGGGFSFTIDRVWVCGFSRSENAYIHHSFPSSFLALASLLVVRC